MLRAKDVAVNFGRTAALDGVEGEVGRGEIVAVMGPSGSGRSTLLYALAGIVRPDRGEVHHGPGRPDGDRRARATHPAARPRRT